MTFEDDRRAVEAALAEACEEDGDGQRVRPKEAMLPEVMAVLGRTLEALGPMPFACPEIMDGVEPRRVCPDHVALGVMCDACMREHVLRHVDHPVCMRCGDPGTWPAEHQLRGWELPPVITPKGVAKVLDPGDLFVITPLCLACAIGKRKADL